MPSEKVTLTKEKETLLITVFAKAGESALPNSLLRDCFAAETVRRIDYDFRKLQVRRDDMVALAMRAHTLDGWTREFLTHHRDGTVLHLGCGLDSRVFRIDPPASIRWFDVDYPEVIALRRRLYPERDGCTMIGSSVTDTDWLAAVPSDRPVMIVAEGLLVYLEEADVLRLLTRLTEHFPNGEIVFDGYSRLGVKMIARSRMIKPTGATPRWALEDPHALEVQVPRLKRVAEHVAYGPSQLARFSWPARLTIRLFYLIPALRKIGRLLRYRF